MADCCVNDHGRDKIEDFLRSENTVRSWPLHFDVEFGAYEVDRASVATHSDTQVATSNHQAFIAKIHISGLV